ncbi:hypothetical protein FQN54_009066 [Arachnomyces sp. PD_36]|nr:hypothetical protein FQN54_009066 [Arachnomyces sp. PD_36]
MPPSNVQHLRAPSHADKLVLSIDQVGVRGIQFVAQNLDPLPDGSPWYQVLDIRKCLGKLRVTFDGLIWSSPSPPTWQTWNNFSLRDGGRLHYVKLGADIKGILVCCFAGRNLGIHGFSDTSKSFRMFVDLMNQRSGNGPMYWIYFPINTNEVIKAAWVRKLRRFNTNSCMPVLTIQTTLGRTSTFGLQSSPLRHDTYEHIPLVRNGDGAVTGIFHDGLDLGSPYGSIMDFGVTCDPNHRTVGHDAEPPFDRRDLPLNWHHGGSSEMTWYLTKAPLGGLVKVRVCRNRTLPHQPCIGLLLYYKYDRVESLGQIRWDLGVSEDVFVPLCFEKEKDTFGKKYIKNFLQKLPSNLNEPRSGDWQELPQEGSVVWWFGRLGDVIDAHTN